MSIERDYIDEFRAHLKAASKSPSTIESYSRDAKDFFFFLQESNLVLDEVDADSFNEYIKNLQSRDSDNSIRRKIIGIRQYFRFLAEFNRTYESPLDYVSIPERDESLPEGLEDEDIDEIECVLGSKSRSIKPSRDLAIFYLLSLEGVKANEVISLKWSHLFITPTRSTLQVPGSKGRTIELSLKSRKAISAYQSIFNENLKSFVFERDSLFVSFKGRDFCTVLPQMTRHGLKFLLYEIGNSVGIKHLNTELLRHYAVKYQLSLGKTPGEIMAHFGLKRMGNIAKHVHALKRQSESDCKSGRPEMDDTSS